MKRAPFLSALLALYLAGCGGGELGNGSAAQGLGDCVVAGELMPVDWLLDHVTHVAEVMSHDLRSAAVSGRTFGSIKDARYVEVSNLAGFQELNAEQTNSLSWLGIGEVEAEDLVNLPDDRKIVVGLEEIDSQNSTGLQNVGYLVVTAVFDDGGGVEFAGNCAEGLFGVPIRAFASKSHPEMGLEEVVVGLMTDEGLLAEFREWGQSEPEVPWTEQDPKLRAMDPELMPPEFVTDMVPLSMNVRVPSSWTKVEATICARVMEAWWSPCIGLAPMGAEGVTDRTIQGWVSKGGDVELWLLDKDPEFEYPIGRLGVVSAEGLGSLPESVSFTIEGPDSVGSLDDLVRLVGTGAVDVAIVTG
jgi:hypothetical protein